MYVIWCNQVWSDLIRCDLLPPDLIWSDLIQSDMFWSNLTLLNWRTVWQTYFAFSWGHQHTMCNHPASMFLFAGLSLLFLVKYWLLVIKVNMIEACLLTQPSQLWYRPQRAAVEWCTALAAFPHWKMTKLSPKHCQAYKGRCKSASAAVYIRCWRSLLQIL